MRRLLRIVLLLSLVALAGGLGFAWTVLSPKIGRLPTIERPAGEAEPKLWSFGFVGDTHHGMTNGVTEPILEKLAAAKVEFVLHLGDQVDFGESEQQWRDWIALARKHRLRVLPVVGNHDVLPNYRDHGEITFRRRLPYLPGTYYHARHRGLNFIMLNSEQSLAPLGAQRHFLRTELAARPGNTIVCLHRPAFTCGERDWANKYLRQLWLHSAIADSDALLVLSGHNHYYDRTHPLDGIVYITSGGGTANVYAAETPGAQTAKFVAGKPHYGLVDVYANRLDFSVYDLDGERLDRFELALRPASEKGDRATGAIELPPAATISAFNESEPSAAGGVPDDQFPRPW